MYMNERSRNRLLMILYKRVNLNIQFYKTQDGKFRNRVRVIEDLVSNYRSCAPELKY